MTIAVRRPSEQRVATWCDPRDVEVALLVGHVRAAARATGLDRDIRDRFVGLRIDDGAGDRRLGCEQDLDLSGRATGSNPSAYPSAEALTITSPGATQRENAPVSSVSVVGHECFCEIARACTDAWTI
jgi:hypothetical protein